MPSPEPLTAADRARRAAQARTAAARLAADGVDGVAVTWVDTGGITRVKAVPLSRLEQAASWGVGASPVFDAFLLDDSTVSGRYAGGPVGDLRLHPDLDRLTRLAALPGWAWAPADRYDQDGLPHPLDARMLARRETDRLAGAGYGIRAAFEIEWCVSAGTGDEFVPACRGPAYGMARLTELGGYLREVLTALAAQGVAVEQVHPEYAAGQYEVSVAAADPVGAADLAVLVRETVRAVTVRHGMRATFAPKVLADGVGNGGHLHLSLWRDGTNLMSGGPGPCGLTPEGEGFAAGILERLPALLAVGAPSVASYLRLVPSHWAGAFACWGRENREAALRLVTGSRGERDRAANIEIKCVDLSANPYLLVAAALAAGRAGAEAGLRLPEPVDIDPAGMDEETRRKRGIAALPGSLAEAVALFEADPVLGEALGPEVVDTVATVRRGEIALFAGASPEEIVARSRWRH
ncbi:glutamine synthetase family protein [Planomonospora venezuelensis]|uniref:Glutamine synthetase n=1 Tax=Planomonospora venezuelensis TaxID=1999 RepID=A0A841CZV4_PLAVE|nr:glutamine synthetase family protein [Planomonospora venezuelensis]MBB5961517.1 glutamine synthetase [Planomonospora venezuelensis]GIM98661.1 glutamine synthetase [Planomonospora venezuelensis]